MANYPVNQLTRLTNQRINESTNQPINQKSHNLCLYLVEYEIAPVW